MRIRDIIEAADPHCWYSANAFASPADGCFIATFDPEHVALMEAVCEAAEDDYMAEPHDDHERNRLATLNAVAALQAYRKERGL